MKETKLIILLQSFEKSELKALDKFIRSPYFNSSDILIKLWEHIKKHSPNFDSPQLNKEKTYKKVFPKKTFNDKNLRQLRSRLFKLVQTFLTTQQFQKNESLSRMQLAEAYYEKDFYDWFEDESRSMIQDIHENEMLHDGHYLNLIQLHHQLYFNQRSPKNLPSPPDLWECSEQIDDFYWLSKLKYAAEWSCRKFLNIEKRPKNIDVSNIPNKYTSPEYPLFYFYYAIYILFNQTLEEGEDLFFETANTFIDSADTIPLKERTPLLFYLLNFCSIGHRKYEEKFLVTLFSLNKVGYENEAFLYKNEIQPTSFSNLVFIGCKMKEIDWVMQFIADYQAKLPLTAKAITINYSLATVDFFKNDFKTAFYRLEKIKYQQPSRELGRKSFQIRCAFECFLQQEDFYEVLQNKSENFQRFINRKDLINEQKRAAFNNLNNAIRQTANLILQKASKIQFIKMIEKIDKQMPFSEKTWILKHLAAFAK